MRRNILQHVQSQRDHRSVLVRSLPVDFPLLFVTYSEAGGHISSIAILHRTNVSVIFLASFCCLITATTLHVPVTQPVTESSVCYFFIFSVLVLTVHRDAMKQLFAAMKKTKMVISSCHYFIQGLLCRDMQSHTGSSAHARCD